jgi:hypothetical protein
MPKYQVRFTTSIEVTVEVEAADEEMASITASTAAAQFLSTVRPEGNITGVGASLDDVEEDSVVEL